MLSLVYIIQLKQRLSICTAFFSTEYLLENVSRINDSEFKNCQLNEACNQIIYLCKHIVPLYKYFRIYFPLRIAPVNEIKFRL